MDGMEWNGMVVTDLDLCGRIIYVDDIQAR